MAEILDCALGTGYVSQGLHLVEEPGGPVHLMDGEFRVASFPAPAYLVRIKATANNWLIERG